MSNLTRQASDYFSNRLDVASLTGEVSPTSPVEEKRASVKNAAAAKKLRQGGEDYFTRLAVAVENGNDLGENAEVVNDFRKLDDLLLINKYGMDGVEARQKYVAAADKARAVTSLEKSLGESIGDTGISVVQGGANLGLGIAQLGAGLVDFTTNRADDLTELVTGKEIPRQNIANKVARFSDSVNAWTNSLKSDVWQQNDALVRVEQDLDKEDSAAQYNRDIDDGNNKFAAGVRRFSRDVVNTVENYVSNPVMLGDVGAQGIGSLGGFSVLSKIFGKSAALVDLMNEGKSRADALRFLATKEGKQLISKKAIASVPGINAAVESGAASGMARNEIMNKSWDEMNGIEEYDALRAKGMTHSQALEALANDASVYAGILGAGVGYLTGKIAPQLEASPLSTLSGKALGASIWSTTKAVAKETGEEFLTEGGSTLSSSIGQNQVGVEKDLLEGLGEASAIGAIGGAFSTAALQGPRTAFGTVKELGVIAGESISNAAEAREERMAQGGAAGVEARAEASQRLSETSDRLTETAALDPETSTQIKSAVRVSRQDTEDYVNLLGSIAGNEDIIEALGPELQNLQDGQGITRSSMIEALGTAAKKAARAKDKGMQTQWSLALLDALRPLDELNSDNIRNAVLGDKDNPAADMHSVLMDDLKVLQSSPNIIQAREHIQSLDETEIAAVFGYNAAAGTMAQPNPDAMSVIASVSPLTLSPQMVAMATNQVVEEAKGKVENYDESRPMLEQVSPEDAGKIRKLQLQEKLVGVAKELETELTSLDEAFNKEANDSEKAKAKPKTLWDVRREIMKLGNQSNSGKAFYQHQQDIQSALDSGQTELALEALQELKNFVISQSNKMEAYNTSAVGGEGNKTKIQFQAYNPDQQTFFDTDKPVFIDGRSNRSIKLAFEVRSDTKALAGLYNAFAEAMGVDGDPLPVPKLDKSIRFNMGPKKKLQKEAGGKIPMIQAIKSMGGVKVGSTLGQALYAAGITNKSAPGLFKKDSGLTEADQITLGDFTNDALDLADDSGLYVQEDKLVNSIRSEIEGTPQPTTNEQQAAAVDLEALLADEAAKQDAKDKKEAEVAKAKAEKEAANKAKALQEAARVADEEQKKKEQQEQAAAEEARREAKFKAEEEAVTPAETPAEIEVTPEQTTPEVAGETLEEVMGENMVSDKNGNRFLQAFRLKADGSNLLRYLAPFKEAMKRLKGSVSGLTAAREETLGDLEKEIPQYVNKFNALLKDIGNKKLKNTETGMMDPWHELLANGSGDLLSFVDKLGVNFAYMDENGDIKVDDRIIEAGVMALAEWVVTKSQVGPKKWDKEKLKKLFKLTDESEVQPIHWTAAKAGFHTQDSVDFMTRRLTELLGVSPKGDVSSSYTQGVMKALAGTMLHMGVERGLINRTITSKVPYDILVIPWRSYTPNRETKLSADLIKNFKGMQEPFASVFVPEHEDVYIIGEPAKPRQILKIRQKDNPTSRLEKQVVRRMEKKQNFLTNLNRFSDAIPQGDYLDLVGYQEIDASTNVNQVEAIDSRNKVLLNGYEGVQNLRQRMQEHAAKEDNDMATEYQVPTFFRWAISSVGRLQQQGPVTPQGNKLMRELVAATKSILDLNQENDMAALKLAIAQSLGVSIEKQSHADSVAWVDAMMEGEYQPAIEAMREYMQLGEVTNIKALKAAFVASNVPKDPKALHAILTMAELQEAIESESLDNFVTSLAIEFDGKTDGPINAIMNLGFGNFTPNQIRTMARGGMFFGQPMSLNEYIAQDGVDLYGDAAEKYQNLLREALKRTNSNGTHVALQILDEFLDDFKYSRSEKGDVDLEVLRNVVKNPLTVLLYGSSAGGITGKIVGAIEDNIYSLLTDISKQKAEGKIKSYKEHPRFVENPKLEELLRRMFGSNFRGMFENPREAEIDVKSKRELFALLEGTVIPPMIQALDETTGGLRKIMNYTQTVSKVQAAYFKDTFLTMMMERKAQRVEEGVLTDKELLSKKDLAEVFMEASKVAPIYTSEDQEFHISLSEVYSKDETVAKSLQASFEVGVEASEVRDPGVKFSPYLTIGTGDGKMMLNIYEDSNSDLDTTLAVFDGVEGALTNIAETAKGINKSVWKGWQETNIADLALISLRQTMRLKKDNAQTARAINQILKSHNSFMDNNYPNDRDLFIKDLDQMVAKMQSLSNENTARKRAMARMLASVDHMAGADAPFVTETGVAIPSNNKGKYDVDTISAQLQTFYIEEMDKLDKDAKDTPTIEPENSKMKAFTSEMGRETRGVPGAVVMGGDALLKGIKNQDMFTKEQRWIASSLLGAAKTLSNVTVVFGTPEQLNQYKTTYMKGSNPKKVEAAQYHPTYNVILIRNQSPETVLHEFLHIVTADILKDYYKDPMSVDKQTREAIKRLELLMNEFKSMTFGEDTAVDRAALTLQNELNVAGRNLDVSMGEFLSWMLSNQNLIKLGKETRTRSVLLRVAQDVLKTLQRVLGIKSSPGLDLFSNVKFNAEILANAPTAERISELDVETQAMFEQVFGPNEPLRTLEDKFFSGLDMHLQAQYPGDANASFRGSVHQKLVMDAIEAAEKVKAAGFVMDRREETLFLGIHAVMSSDMEMNTAAVTKANKLYSRVVNSDLMDQKPSWKTLLEGNSKELMPTFIALSQVSNEFADDLATIPAPRIRESAAQNEVESRVDQLLTAAANTAINTLTDMSISRKSLGKNMRDQLDSLTLAMSDIKDNRRNTIEAMALKPIDQIEEMLSGGLQKGAAAVSDGLNTLSDKAPNKYVAAPLKVASLLIGIMDSKTAGDRAKAWTTVINGMEGAHETRALLNDLKGTDPTTRGLIKLLNQVKAKIDAMRQDYREKIPAELAKMFSKKLKRKIWNQMSKGILHTDLMALETSEAMALISNQSTLPQSIRDAEKEVMRLAKGNRGRTYLSKAINLGKFMNDKNLKTNTQLRNSYAIARLAGHPNSLTDAQVSQELVEAIDKLVTLRAFENLDADVKATLSELAQSDPTALENMMKMSQTVRQQENTKIDRLDDEQRQLLRLNGWKGYAPSVTPRGHELVVKPASEHAKMITSGYIYVGPYRGDRNDPNREPSGYYQSTVGSQAAFRQGVAQTVTQTFNGIDLHTGVTRNGTTAGPIMGRAANRITANRNGVRDNLTNNVEGLMPIYNKDGKIIGYERSLDPEKSSIIEHDNHMGRMLGVWMGRMLEEDLAIKYNKSLIDELKKNFDDGITDGRSTEYVNIAESTDPVIKDAWNVLGKDIKDYAAEVFGTELYLPIRKDMITDAVGYRSASVRDVFTGETRWNGTATKAVKDAAILIMGEKAYRNAAWVENHLQDAVSYAKTTIVVRSFLVMKDNIIANNLYLLSLGVSPIELVKGTKDKFLEITQYTKNREKILELELELSINIQNPNQRRKIEAQISAIEAANKKMSIAPLIEAGEFSTISESLTEADQAIREGKFSDFIEKAADKLPDAVQTIGKNFLVAKDTALFQGLNRGIQYGDFIAKAILYDHLTKNKGQDKEKVLDRISEEFVNYNRNAGRGRDYLESIGMLWFMNYKIRIMKIAIRTMRDRPLTALLYTAGLGPALDIDTIPSGSLAGAWWRDSLGYAVGPEMGIDSLGMNPWMNVVN